MPDGLEHRRSIGVFTFDVAGVCPGRVGHSTRNGSALTPRKSTAALADADLFSSVLVVGEIRKGVEQTRSRDPVKTRALEAWLGGLEQKFADRVLPVMTTVADHWGRLSAIRPISTVDGMLAATALCISRGLCGIAVNLAVGPGRPGRDSSKAWLGERKRSNNPRRVECRMATAPA